MMVSAISLENPDRDTAIFRKHCKEIKGLQLEKSFTRAEEAISYLSKFPIDLLILNYEAAKAKLPEILAGMPQQTVAILLGGISEAVAHPRVVRVLSEEFSMDDCIEAFNAAKHQLQSIRNGTGEQEKHFFVRVDYKLAKVVVEDILLVEGYDDYIKIHQNKGKVLVVRMTMRSIINKLPESDFLRIHRSFIVRKDRVEAVNGKFVMMNGRQLPVGGSYEAQVKQCFHS
jgi:two-component system LytT family response regulator